MSRKYILICIFLLPLQACHFSVGVLGRVFDKETGQPIALAMVNLLNGQDMENTNSDGFFEVFSQSRPSQDAQILVSKDGYKPFQLKIVRTGDQTTYVIESELISVKYDQPIYLDPKDRNTFIIGTSIDKWSTDFRTGDTLSIYLVREDIKGEVEKIRKQVENSK